MNILINFSPYLKFMVINKWRIRVKIVRIEAFTGLWIKVLPKEFFPFKNVSLSKQIELETPELNDSVLLFCLNFIQFILCVNAVLAINYLWTRSLFLPLRLKISNYILSWNILYLNHKYFFFTLNENNNSVQN